MKTALSILAVLFTLTATAQSSPELFAGESKLNDCRQDIPLSYKPKDQAACIQKAKELEGQEIIYLKYDKKTKQASYERFYLVNEEITNGTQQYLVKKENFEASKNEAVFIKLNPKYDRFYTASCFDKVKDDNSEVKGAVKEGF